MHFPLDSEITSPRRRDSSERGKRRTRKTVCKNSVEQIQNKVIKGVQEKGWLSAKSVSSRGAFDLDSSEGTLILGATAGEREVAGADGGWGEETDVAATGRKHHFIRRKSKSLSFSARIHHLLGSARRGNHPFLWLCLFRCFLRIFAMKRRTGGKCAEEKGKEWDS